MHRFNHRLALGQQRALACCALAVLAASACSQSNGEQRPAASQPSSTLSQANTSQASASQANTAQGSPNVPANAQPPASIGTASMKDDGTIVLMLRATGPGGMLGDSRVEYPKGHANYEQVLKHLGGLKPGENKPVPPFP